MKDTCIRIAITAGVLATMLAGALPVNAVSPAAMPSAAVEQQADRAGVIRSTERYVAAIKAKDGAAAAKYIDAKSIKWYADSAKLAVSANRRQWEKLKFAQRLVVARLRHELARDDLRKLDGPKTLAFGVDKGWIDPESVNNLKVANVRVTGKTAKASLAAEPNKFVLSFVKEGDTWKFSVVDLINLTNPVFERTAAESGMEPLEFMTFVIESTSSRKVDPAIFDGPLNEIPTETETPAVPANATQTIESDDGTFTLTVPGNWKSLKLNNDASLQAGDGATERFVVVINDEKALFDSFAEFDETAVGAIRNNLNDNSTAAGRMLKINGLDARQYTLSGRVSGIDISYLYTTINGKKGYYQILLWTRKSRFTEAQRDFEDIAASFAEQ